MATNYFSSEYVQTLLPTIRDTQVASLVGGTANLTGTGLQTAVGLYGPGSYVVHACFGGSRSTGTLYIPDCTVELRNSGGIVGTLYSALGTAAQTPGDHLGKALSTTAWITVTPSSTLDLDRKLIVDYVREA